jgi:hypothetical protein
MVKIKSLTSHQFEIRPDMQTLRFWNSDINNWLNINLNKKIWAEFVEAIKNVKE